MQPFQIVINLFKKIAYFWEKKKKKAIESFHVNSASPFSFQS